MYTSAFLVVSVAAFVPLSQAASYYVAPNCDTSYPSISTTSFPEAWAMARNVAGKVAANDVGEKIAFSKLFKIGTIGKPLILSYFATLGSMSKVDDPKLADIIYDCDNDARWQPVLDSVGNPRPKQYKDETYHMRTERTLSCTVNRAIMTTYSVSVPTDGWKAERSVVSVCKKLERSYNGWATVSKFEDRLLAGKMLDPEGKEKEVGSVLDNPCTSRTILHEAFHSILIKPKKSDLAKGACYGWEKGAAFSATDQIQNADNYAVYAFSMFLNGYRLGDSEDDQNQGILVKVGAATKRLVNAAQDFSTNSRSFIRRRRGASQSPDQDISFRSSRSD